MTIHIVNPKTPKNSVWVDDIREIETETSNATSICFANGEWVTVNNITVKVYIYPIKLTSNEHTNRRKFLSMSKDIVQQLKHYLKVDYLC